MTEREILEEFKYRYLNTKTNNYIFYGLDNFKMLNCIPDRCIISIAESYINIECAQNIKIDLAEVNVKDILTYTLDLLKKLSLLDVTLDYTLEFNNKFDLLKFQHVLRNYGIVVQLIFYNIEKLNLEEQMLFNEIYYFNSIFFNANSFIKGNNFQSYFLSNERVLDNRENYTKIKIIKRKNIPIENISIKTDKFVKQFVEKLNNNEFVKDICPQVEEGFIPTVDVVEEELKKYNELLGSSILDNITKDCRTCQNMSCRVEQNEKPVDGCLGYINHRQDIEGKGKQLVKTIGGK